jgi:DNA-binding MarR family transcriptional regulator
MNDESENFQEWNPPARRRSSLPGGADLARRLMDDMDPEVLEFLKTAVNTFVKWDLVLFFYENPNTTDAAANIARYIGRDAASIQAELDELVNVGVLQREFAADLAVYSLTSDAQVRERIRQFASASDDRQFRVKAIYHLIRGTR